MPGIFQRIREIGLANIHAALDRAEDPVKMCDQYLRDMEDEIEDAVRAVSLQTATKISLEKKYQSLLDEVGKYQTYAERAVEQGNDELARKALVNKNKYQQQADELKPQLDAARATTEELNERLRDMREKFDEMKAKRDVLVARAEAAKAQKKVNQTVGGIGDGRALRGLERMEAAVNRMEAEAQATRSLSEQEEDPFRELMENERSHAVEDELAALKQKLGKAQ
ncbi:PspA/IM30 family protein [Alicyclobacillus shizuokensis]|uniref:PspA/IM30 family protein n=1 Tax=Alicyclobacillus shizuokensis TaxID=392014 RepID=UPI00082C3ECC|nr:PspA/IM30 family protein [Alicyclobacillus shizuokensis]